MNQVKELSNYEALIIAKPQSAYSENEKFMLDQYILKGGKVLFFIDPVYVSLDSIQESGTVAVSVPYNLDDLLFKYGLRLNENLIQDMQATHIPVIVGEIGGRPDRRMVPWRYYPLINNFSDHPLVKNTDIIYTKFVSSIDTVKVPGVNKIPLMFTSRYAKVFSAPLQISLNDARRKVNPEEFDHGPLPVAFLLEGEFTSLYKNRPLPLKNDSGYIEKGKNCQIFVCSDGDIIRNEVLRRKNQIQEVPLPGGNKDLISNIVDYMLDEKGLIHIKAKEIALRPLDKIKLRDDRMFWQIINLVFPVVFVILFGLTRFYLRKKKYERE
jgi:gliding-associated putative ABC transporter substrate-binding component GldG